ncbi:MAG: 16S rRNA (cytosine(1402)-N(4))-methyltransferase RsmH [Clostridia bacterium]|nr:16S rRNA (cytosine(1402)-N(4))-methyltransferase RsmH [Clostridia bacterium]
MEFKHIPIMLEECMEGLGVKEGGVYIDCTLGSGGHSSEIAKRLKRGRLIGFDLDGEAIAAASRKLAGYKDIFTAVNDNFKNFRSVLDEMDIPLVDGILIDLGVSSYQLDNRERGFSYMSRDSRLNMKMNQSQEFSAYNVVNEYDEDRLSAVISDYGEERFAKKIAALIVKRRQTRPIETTGELVDIITSAIPKKFQKDGHPAQRTFQAIRIEVNGELDGLKECLYSMVRSLKKGGRICCISFHSLEDRIVKNCFKDLETDCVCDKRLPVCVCGKRREIKVLTNRPITASAGELAANPRAKSAKLRVAEKI